MRDMNLGPGFELPASILVKHLVVMGASGSGKTVFCKDVVEEAVRANIPVVAVDLQGDIASLGLTGDPMATDPVIASDYFKKLDFKVWTPGTAKGLPLSLTPSLYVGDGIEEEDDREEAWDETATVLAQLLMGKAKREVVAAFSRMLEYAWVYDLEIADLNEFADLLADPPMELLQAIDPFLDAKARKAVAREIVVTVGSPDGRMLRKGMALDVETLLGYEAGGPASRGKTRVSVIYLKNLDEAQRALFIASLASALYRWAMTQKGADSPRALFYLDEAAPYCPPSNVKRPPSKDPLSKLLRQGRKYGLGCIIATQSPGDLDYNALGQVGTWVIGRLPMEQQLDKVWPALRASGGNPDDLISRLPGLGKGQLVVSCPDHFAAPMEVKPRWLATLHEVVDDDGVRALVTSNDRALYGER